MRCMLVILTITVLLCPLGYSDDIYLKTGFVFRNVQVVDTTNGVLNFRRSGAASTVSLGDITKIDMIPVQSGQESKYELYSQQLYEIYLATAKEREIQKVSPVKSSPSQEIPWSIILESQDTLTGCTLLSATSDSLVYDQNGSITSIAIDSIKGLVRSHPSRFLVGALVGSLVGVATGAIIGSNLDPTNYVGGGEIGAAIGLSLGFLIGGITGSAFGGEEIYVLENKSKSEKFLILTDITSSE